MLDKMLSEFKDFAELQEFAQAQHQTIVTQMNRIKDLEEKIKQNSTTIFLDGAVSVHDEETISRIQLGRFKEVAETRELTLEEARKVEIYSKIINTLELRNKKDNSIPRDVTNDELIKQLTDGKPEII